MTRHSVEVARFTNGETRLVYARHRDAPPGAPLYYLPDNTVTRELRVYARQHLICVVPDCPSVGLTAASRTTKRDGFVHRGANVITGHAPESVNHLQGKAAVVAWLARTHPELDVRTEVDLAGGERRADVLVTFPGGQRVAIEVQYAALTVAQWEERHQSYAAMGIVDVWLFGHTGAHLSVRDGDVYPNEVHRTVMNSGAPLLWLNPTLDKIATATTTQAPIRDPGLGGGYPVTFTDGHDGSVFTVPAWTGPAELGIDPFDDARLTPTGIRTRRQDALEAARAALDAINFARAQVIADARARRDLELAAARARQAEAERLSLVDAARREAEKAAADAASNRERQAVDAVLAAQGAGVAARQARERQRVQAEAAVRFTVARDQVVTAFGGVPAFLRVQAGPFPLDMTTCWQWETYRDVIHQAVGGSFTVWDAYRSAEKTIGPGRVSGLAVRAWLAALVRMGMLAVTDSSRYAVVHRADIVVPAPRQVRQPPEATRRATPPVRQELNPVPLGKVKTCKGCANPLTGTESGKYHAGCEPWQAKAARWAPK